MVALAPTVPSMSSFAPTAPLKYPWYTRLPKKRYVQSSLVSIGLHVVGAGDIGRSYFQEEQHYTPNFISIYLDDNIVFNHLISYTHVL